MEAANDPDKGWGVELLVLLMLGSSGLAAGFAGIKKLI